MRDSRPTYLIMAVCALAWGAIVLHKSYLGFTNVVHEATVSREDVRQFARSKLTELQARSFAEDIELCSLIAENARGELVARTVLTGDTGTCDLAYFDVRSLLPRATVHTHAGYNEEFDSEVPSSMDLEGDFASQIDGYISTPGGRLWHVDYRDRVARQICGEGCLPRDENYRSCNAPEPEAEYTLTTLRAREASYWEGC